jgi:hypothetical protein
MSLLFDSAQTVDIGGFLSLVHSLHLQSPTALPLPVFRLKWFCVDNFLTLMFWFLELKTYSYPACSPFHPSLLTALVLILMLPLRRFPAGSIQKKLVGGGVGGWFRSFPYTDISVFLWVLEQAVNAFISVTGICHLMIVFCAYFCHDLHQCNVEHNSYFSPCHWTLQLVNLCDEKREIPAKYVPANIWMRESITSHVDAVISRLPFHFSKPVGSIVHHQLPWISPSCHKVSVAI